MQNLYQPLINDQDDFGNDIYSEILNDIHGHLDLDQICKYHKLCSYDNLSAAPNHLNILHINTRSLQNKLEQISALLCSLTRAPDIICVSETWLQESSFEFCNINGYHSYHVFRRNRCHGGVSVFVSNHLNSNQVTNLSFIHDDIELNTVEVIDNRFSYTVCAVYRPHGKYDRVDSFTLKLSELLTSNVLHKKRVILVGDFNINLLEIENHAPTNNFLAHMQSQNYFIHTCRPTRYPDGHQAGMPSLLDHIYTNFYTNFKTGILLSDFSDHLPVFINIPLPSPVTNNNSASKTIKKSYRNYSHINKAKFTNLLANTNWDDILTSDDVNTNSVLLNDFILTNFNDCFPLQTKEISLKTLDNPWITPAVKTSVKNKSKLFSDFNQGLIPFDAYRIYRNQLNNTIKQAKSLYYMNYFEKYKNCTRKIWQKINELKNVKTTKRNYKIKVNDTLTDNKSDISEAFNRFYTNIGANLDSSLPNPHKNPLSQCSHRQGQGKSQLSLLSRPEKKIMRAGA